MGQVRATGQEKSLAALVGFKEQQAARVSAVLVTDCESSRCCCKHLWS